MLEVSSHVSKNKGHPELHKCEIGENASYQISFCLLKCQVSCEISSVFPLLFFLV